MNVQKRLGALLLALLLTVSVPGVMTVGAAATDVELTAAETDGGVTLTLWARTDFAGVGGLEFSFDYDAAAFAYASISSPVDGAPSVNQEVNSVSILSEQGVPVSAGSALAELKFTKKEGFVKGTDYTFTLHVTQAFNADVEPFDWAQESYYAHYSEEPDAPQTGAVDLRGISIRKSVDTASAYDPITFRFTVESKSAPEGATPPVFEPLTVTMSDTMDSALLSLPGEVWVDAPGTYEYTVRETAGSAEGWTYDSTAYVLRLEITRDDAGAYALKEWGVTAPGGAAVGEMTFKNTYAAPQPAFEPPAVRFRIRQVINLGSSGLSANDVIVRYSLTGATTGAPLPAAAKNGAFQVALRGTGTYQAPEITFSQPGTWKYNLTAASTNADMTPETIVITVTVEPTGEAKVTSALTNGVACDIQFTANARAAATPTPTPTPRPGTVQTPTPTPTPKNTSGKTPQTGDTPRVFVFALIALVATAILAVLAAWEIKDRRRDRN